MFSILGWVYECIYCSVRAGCWQNMGFLFGPVCPIYGTGAVTVILMGMYITPIASGKIPFWQLFLFFAIGSAVLEYVTSWAMEKRFHARWWDYSDMPTNRWAREF